MRFKNKRVPCQAAFNKLYLDETTQGTCCLNHLKLYLICQRFLFNNILTMPRGQTSKLQRAVANVLVSSNKTYTLLSSDPNIIMVEMKKQ